MLAAWQSTTELASWQGFTEADGKFACSISISCNLSICFFKWLIMSSLDMQLVRSNWVFSLCIEVSFIQLNLYVIYVLYFVFLNDTLSQHAVRYCELYLGMRFVFVGLVIRALSMLFTHADTFKTCFQAFMNLKSAYGQIVEGSPECLRLSLGLPHALQFGL